MKSTTTWSAVLVAALQVACAPTRTPPSSPPAPAEQARASTAAPSLAPSTTEPQRAALRVEPEHAGLPYDRDAWDGGRWADDDGDCQDTRAELLIATSEVPATLDAKGCRVLTGRWRCPYTGKLFTSAGDLQIDHLVALKEAHDSGGWAWAPDRRRAFAEDLAHLVVASRSANGSKKDHDPAEWTPPAGDRCAYVRAWATVKARWDLAVDQAEAAVIAVCR